MKSKFTMSLHLLRLDEIAIGERVHSPSGRTLPGYVLKSPVHLARAICKYAIAIHRAPGPL